MEWHQFLREERNRKLQSIEWLETRSNGLSTMIDGYYQDTSEQMIAEHRSHIAEIEEILKAASEPLA